MTLLAFALGDAVSARLRRHPLANPVVIAAGLLIALLIATGTPYSTYFEGAQFVHFLLGPATVALGLPLWRNRVAVRAQPPADAGGAGGGLAHRHRLGGGDRLGARRPAPRSSPRSPRSR